MADSTGPDTSAPTEKPDTPAATAAPAVDSAAQPLPTESRARTARTSSLVILLLAFTATGVGSLILLASAIRTPDTDSNASASVQTAGPGNAAAAAAIAPSVAAVDPTDAPSAPTWTTSTNPRKVGFRGAIVFELAADGDVGVWRQRVRPVLTVRCAARTTEVFIVTRSPATIEGHSNQHTVKVSFDGGEPVEQMWEHSIDHDALFAPDGGPLMRRISGARTMTFTFAPFNAPPATATFSVAGFETLRRGAGRRCGA